MAKRTTDPPTERRLRGQRGTAVITVSVLLFALTAGTIVVLARDVNRSVANRSAAQSIAFQAARAGAQQIDLVALRGTGVPSEVDLVESEVESVARSVAQELFGTYGVTGEVEEVRIDDTTVSVEVTISDPAGNQTAVGTAEPQTGP